jgi:phosphatidylglycerol phospholipase C
MHVKFNIDVKLDNEPDRLYSLMHKIISAQTNWERDLAPRLLLGVWHTKFLPAAKQLLPYCRRSFIGTSTSIAREYFWDDVQAFSIYFNVLSTADGKKCVP